MSRYLITGGAGFIGTNIVLELLNIGHTVRVLDNFSTGFRENLASIQSEIEIFDGDICDSDLVARSMKGVDYCLHQAALGSVPRSIDNPKASNRVNVEGSMTVLLAARDSGVKRVVCASSSSIYGNHSEFPTKETIPRSPRSPYAVSKASSEMYMEVFSEIYGIEIICLRYFNVFGPYQNPFSQYSAVIPIFINQLLNGVSPTIHGDGSQSRDFSYVENVVRANLSACEAEGAASGFYNIACGKSTSVLGLATMIADILNVDCAPEFIESRAGDIVRSQASIEKATSSFGYTPFIEVRGGLERTVDWYKNNASHHPKIQ
jgi:nucleoside-diphosphate-sugar epimerase